MMAATEAGGTDIMPMEECDRVSQDARYAGADIRNQSGKEIRRRRAEATFKNTLMSA